MNDVSNNDESSGAQDGEDTRPVIYIETDKKQVVDHAEAALMSMYPPCVFQRGRALLMVTQDGPKPKWLTRAPGTPTTEAISPEYLSELCSTAAEFEKFDKRSKDWCPALPPAWLPATLL
jgi:hypothetical protein